MLIETPNLENINPPNWLMVEAVAGRAGWNTKPRVINNENQDEVESVLLVRVCRTCQCAQLSCICDAPQLDVIPVWRREQGLNDRLVKYLKVKKEVHGAEKSLPSFEPYKTAEMLCRQTLWAPMKNVPSQHQAAKYMRQLFQEGDRILVMLIHSTETWIKWDDIYYTSRDGKNYVSRSGQILIVNTNDEGKKYVGESAAKQNLVSPRASTEEYPRSLSDATDEVFIQTLKEKNADGWNIYVAMNAIHEKSNARTKADIAAIRSVYCEVDENGEECLAAVRSSASKGDIPEPSIILQSSIGKFQFIWFVRDFTAPQQEAHDRALQEMFKTDPEAVDCSRVLRLPDFYNVKPKYDPKPLVFVLFESESLNQGVRYVPSDFKIDTQIKPDVSVGKTAPPETIKIICGEIEKSLTKAEIDFTAEETKGTWVYSYRFICPNPLHTTVDRYRTVSVRADGVIGSNCYHSNCDGKDWKWLRGWLEEINKEKMRFPRPKTQNPTERTAHKQYVLNFTRERREGSAFDFVLGHILGGTEGWFPLGDPSLIGGPSGGNKTTLMVDLLEAQHKKEDFLGHPTYGLPYLILMADRGENAQIRTARRMRFDPSTLPIDYLSSVQGEAAAQEILSKIEACEEIPSIVFIEGCDMLVENASKMEVVSPFVEGLQRIAKHYHIAIVGSVGAGKHKAGEGYTSKRDQIFGSIAWGRKVETIVVLEYVDDNDTDKRRILSVLLRNGAPEKYRMLFQDGRLIVDNRPEEEAEETASRPEIAWMRVQNDWFTAMDVVRALRVAKATGYRYVEDAYAKRILISKKKVAGEARLYHWNDGETNPERIQADVTLDAQFADWTPENEGVSCNSIKGVSGLTPAESGRIGPGEPL